jgi:hypothetical protein
MSQAGFPLFPLPQQHTTVSYGDILNTLTISHECAPLHGSGSSDSLSSLTGHFGSNSSTSLDNSLLSSAPISLYTNTSLTASSSVSPRSPQTYAYTQLARQYQQCKEELKKIDQEHRCLKYMSLFSNVSYIPNTFTEQHMRT